MSSQWPDPTDPHAIRAHLDAHRASPVAVRSWAGRMVTDRADHGPVPPLGGPAWQALPDTDPRKLHSALIAAVAWVDENTPAAISARVWAEQVAVERATLDRLKDAARDAHTAMHRHGGFQSWISHAELTRRRTTFTTDPRTPEQIRAAAYTSWGLRPTTENHTRAA
ncbi:hypothetical protein [Actinokineospora iranica]|uniref:Uncharacterized protein n=1 Tax=Actinokineospora iranica TaxID=1271860 RepID=A0A1G6WSQ3_9PSEU|nr:hypothetical protein [Actinokineospora iranica]SDD68126.1 hypothetical protein SAMN05216174_115126 [Actinokineospora iranica]